MKYGFVYPGGDARTTAILARELEDTGWDGFFVWEPVWGVNAWVTLAATAMQTERIRLGTMITPLSRMRPWKLASETATLDHLSNGRTILAVELGATGTGFEAFGEVTDRKTRAELLDEGLEILTDLWRGQPFSYQGKHYSIKETSFYPPPPPVQYPRIPIWVVGLWPAMKSMRQALKYDGLLPAVKDEQGNFRAVTPREISEILAHIKANRVEESPFDIVIEGQTPGNDPEKAAGITRSWAGAGAAWWIEANWSALDESDGMKWVFNRARQGPPR